MPGIASLEAGQYYAHPRNLFRPLIEDLFAVKNRPLSYCQLLALLADRKIALWDVLQSCVRAGSLDSAITCEIPNDFAAFFAAHPRITHIYFNGKKAAQSFQKFVDPHCVPAAIMQTVLPSTSPANASLSYDHKRKAWAALLTD